MVSIYWLEPNKPLECQKQSQGWTSLLTTLLLQPGFGGKFNFPIFQIGKLEEKCSFHKVGPDFWYVPSYPMCRNWHWALIKKPYSERKALPFLGRWLPDFGHRMKSHTFLWQLWVFLSSCHIFPRTFSVGLWLPSIKGKGIITLSKSMPKSLHWNVSCYAHPSAFFFSFSSNTLPTPVSLSLSPLFCL